MKTLGWPLIIFQLRLLLFLHTAAFHYILSLVTLFLVLYTVFMLFVTSHFLLCTPYINSYWYVLQLFFKTPCSFFVLRFPFLYFTSIINYLSCIPFLPFLVINNFLTQLLMVNCSCNNSTRENEKYSF